MNHFDFYDYIQRLHLFVESQDKKITQLENLVQTLIEEVNTLKNKPSIKVEKIEYKFDQLKVETLEGTLNIGLNPTDLQAIEDFTVEGKQAVGNPVDPASRFQTTIRIEENILQNMESEVNSIIKQYELDNQVIIDQSYITFIKDDIRKQLPNRIQYHLNQISASQRLADQELEHEQRIIEFIKSDIKNGIHVFLNNLPNEVKGRK